jgi:hypothetical protein
VTDWAVPLSHWISWQKPINIKLLKTDNQEYEWVKGFKYLETVLTEYNDITAEMKQRRIMANKTSYGLKEQMNGPNFKRYTKSMLCKTFLWPVLSCGSERWPLSKKDGNMFRIFERRILIIYYSYFHSLVIYGIIFWGSFWFSSTTCQFDNIQKWGLLYWYQNFQLPPHSYQKFIS